MGFRWPHLAAAARLYCCPATWEDGPSSSSRSIASRTAAIAASAFSFARPERQPTAIDLYADAGIEFIGLSNARPDDKFGIAAGYAHVSKRAQALDTHYRALTDPNLPTRTFEGLLTAVYQYQVREGWTIQPNFQYIVRPGGGITDPPGPMAGRVLKNAAVLGLRTTLKF
jgi:carbohydrate-selective porin OprB